MEAGIIVLIVAAALTLELLLASRDVEFAEKPPATRPRFVPQPLWFEEPERVSTDVIGTYMGAPIHRTVTIDGLECEFLEVLAPGNEPRPGTHCIAPGLLYAR